MEKEKGIPKVEPVINPVIDTNEAIVRIDE
jgi:hypothetical protein